jgi:hypothetical protein
MPKIKNETTTVCDGLAKRSYALRDADDRAVMS